jgi:hypothetical protein
MILKIFSPTFLTQNEAKLSKIRIVTLFFLEKKRHFFAENGRKSKKYYHNIDTRCQKGAQYYVKYIALFVTVNKVFQFLGYILVYFLQA